MQRTLGVTYKTAYRIGMQVLTEWGKVDSFQVLKGHVEIDETYFGGYRPRSQGGKDAKTIIMGMKERGGRIETKIIPNVQTGHASALSFSIASRKAQPFQPMNWRPASY